MLLTRPASLAFSLSLFAATPLFAQRQATAASLVRLEEALSARVEEGLFSLDDMKPVIVVSVMPRFEETRTWYPTAALRVLIGVFGPGAVRSCEACMAPRVFVEDGRIEQNLLGLSLEEIQRLDASGRGTAPAARAAIWLDETPSGVSLRIVELATGQVLFAQNFDPTLKEEERSERTFNLTRELERRLRGESLAHTFVDVGVWPGQHISIDWVEQWGGDNLNLTGVTVSALDPLVGVGAAYYRVIPQAFDLTLGGKLLLSLPTAIGSGITGEVTDLIDPLLTGVAVARVPIPQTNFALYVSASTNFTFTAGMSLLNTQFFPVLP